MPLSRRRASWRPRRQTAVLDVVFVSCCETITLLIYVAFFFWIFLQILLGIYKGAFFAIIFLEGICDATRKLERPFLKMAGSRFNPISRGQVINWQTRF